MKVYFGESLDDMIRELRARGISSVRVHALQEVGANALTVTTHVTTLCGNQIYESVIPHQYDLQNIDPQEEETFVRQACEEERDKIAEKLSGFEIRAGILQE